jgi:hypothetical protein
LKRFIAPELEGLLLRNVPEGRCDRSLARSAWDSATPKEPSRRVRCDPRRCAHQFDFSVGISQVQETVHDIEQQLEHHRTRTFEKEYYLAFFKKHGAPFDEKDLWG